MPATAIGNGQLTLVDWARRVDPDGKIGSLPIVEILARENSIVQDASFVEGNTTTGHLTTLRTGLPAVAFRQLNAGIQPSKSTTKQIHFTAAWLEGLGKVDERLVGMASDGPGLRLSEVSPFMESMGQTIASTMFYGDVRVNPDRFTGLSAYYANLNPNYQQSPEALLNPSTTGQPDSGRNVFDASTNSEGETFGTPANGNNTSLWLVCWGENGITAFFPKGSKAGVSHEDLGRWLVDDGRGIGAQYLAWVDIYRANVGLAPRDWRQASRIANIDVVALQSAGDDNDQSANLLKNMIQAKNYVQDLNKGRAFWYCNRVVKTYLEVKAMNKFNNMLTTKTLENGETLTSFAGIPIHRCDAILNTEAQVS